MGLSEESTSRRKNRRERELANRRDDAIDGAAAVFAAKGFHEAQMTEIAAAAELSLASLYSMFRGKEELFRGASGVLMRALNGISVRRGRRENVVQQMARAFAERDELYLLIAPEGTRKRVDYLKSGFYQIARAANVPIWPGFVDYERKRSGVGPLVYPSGDVKKDMDALRAFYRENAAGRHPELTGRFRLPEEDEN